MEADLVKKYEPLVGYIEEPIREVVQALWRLPFVLDTGHTCSGHALAQHDAGYEPFSREYSWYPHRAILEFAFSLDPEMTEIRDQFRNDLRKVLVEGSGVKLCFDDVRAHQRDKLPSYTGPSITNLNEMYNASVPELEKSEASVQLVESLLVSFWEKIAAVVCRYNPEARIGPIQGKDFRHVINWDHWGGIFINRQY